MLEQKNETCGLLEIKEVCLSGGIASIPHYIYAAAAQGIGVICGSWLVLYYKQLMQFAAAAIK